MATNKTDRILNVPTLRFPGFTEEWENEQIGNICETITDYVAAGSFASLKENVLYYQEDNYAQLVRTVDLKNNFTNKDFVFIDKIAYDFLWRVQLTEPNIVLPNIGANIGEKYYVRPQDLLKNKNVLGPNAILLRSESNDTHFVYYRLSTRTYDNEIKKLVGASGQPKFNKTDLKKIKLFMPLMSEQKKIADFLSLLDERISLQSNLIDRLKSLMDGIVVRHWNGVEKKKYCLTNLGEAFSVMNLSKEDLTEDGKSCIIYGELFTTYDAIIDNVVSHTDKFDRLTLSGNNDLLFPASTTVNAYSLIAPSAITERGVVLGGDMFGIHISQEHSAEYISLIINAIYRNKLSKYAKGSTIIHLHYGDIKNVEVELPDLKTQLYLVGVVKRLRTKLSIENDYLIKLNKAKQSLLLAMFI